MAISLPKWRPAINTSSLLRWFSHVPHYAAKPLPPRLMLPDGDIEENFLKGTGPGGQKINKTNSAVQLKHIPSGLVVKCQETRSRSQNRKIARRVLAERLEDIEKGDQSRTAIKRQAAAKKKASKAKKARRKYRKLDEERSASSGTVDEPIDREEGEAISSLAGAAPSPSGGSTSPTTVSEQNQSPRK